MYIVEAFEADIFRLTALNKTKFNEFDNIVGKTPLIFREI